MICLGEQTAPTEQIQTYGTLLGILLAVLTVTGNALVLLAVYRTPSLRNITNYFLASLAAADFSVGILALPMFIISLFLEYDTVLVVTNALYMQSLAASTYNLCAVTIDRYIAVRWPLRYHSLMTVKTFQRIVLFLWIFSILAGCIPFLVRGDLFWLITTSVLFVVPFAVIAFCYAYMLKEARRQNRDASERTAGEMAARTQNHKAAVTVAIVIILFLVFSLPIVVVSVAEAVGDSTGLCKVEERFSKGSNWVALISYSNSAINPLIYALRRKEFREAFKKVFRRNAVLP